MSRLDPTKVDELRSRVEHDVDKGLVHAAQLAIAVDGSLEVVECFGAVTPDERVPLYSATKVLPALATLRLVGDGRIDPADRVVDHLPWFTGGGKDEIVVDHLLLHTAGLPRAPLGPPEWSDPAARRAKIASWYVTSRPGDEFEYHATSASWVLAELVAAVVGTDHCAAIHALVTEPLGLPRFLGLDDREVPIVDLVPVAEGELDIDLDLGEVTFDTLLRFNDHDVRRTGVPGAGGYATAADVALLYQGLMANPGELFAPDVLADAVGNVRVTADDLLRAAPANRTRAFLVAGHDGKAAYRGFPVEAGPRTFGHDGAGGQVAWADPDVGVSVAYLPAGLDPDMMRLTRRSVAVSTRARRCVTAV